MFQTEERLVVCSTIFTPNCGQHTPMSKLSSIICACVVARQQAPNVTDRRPAFVLDLIRNQTFRSQDVLNNHHYICFVVDSLLPLELTLKLNVLSTKEVKKYIEKKRAPIVKFPGVAGRFYNWCNYFKPIAWVSVISTCPFHTLERTHTHRHTHSIWYCKKGSIQPALEGEPISSACFLFVSSIWAMATAIYTCWYALYNVYTYIYIYLSTTTKVDLVADWCPVVILCLGNLG